MWREALRAYIQDVQQRQRIALALGVHPLTLVRWASRVSTPRPQHLRDLPNFLPEQRDMVLQSILEEFPSLREPHYKEHMHGLAPAPITDLNHKILRILSVISPVMRFEVLCENILAEAVGTLDPHKHGIALLVARCMPPAPGQKVRSLLVSTTRGTSPWERYLDQAITFLGIESLAGQAVSTLSPGISKHLFNNLTHPTHLSYFGEQVQSSIATPILHLGSIGGCLIALSAQPHSFSFVTQRDFKDIANLLALSLSPEAFYLPEQVDLAPLPAYNVQKAYLSTYDQRVDDLMNGEGAQSISYVQASQIIWSQIEKEVLHLSSPTPASNDAQAMSMKH
ncbi:MAG: hypothetical protein PVS3B1_28610 [Ktedonobacteraceae bacterium]